MDPVDTNSLGRFSLNKKILVLIIGMTMTAVILTLFIVYTVTGKAISRTLENDLKKTEKVFDSYQSTRYREIEAEGHLIGEIPFLKALISTKDRSTILGFANTLKERTGTDLILFMDENGDILASTDEQLSTGNLKGHDAVREALEGRILEGTMTVGDTLYRTRSSAIQVGESLLGVMIIGFRIDDVLAAEIKAMTDSEISFIIGNRVVASTWTPPAREELVRLMPEMQEQIEAVAQMGRPSPAFNVRLNGDYLSVLLPLTKDSRSNGAYLIQRSRDEVAHFLTNIRNAVFIVAFLILIAATWASYLIAGHIAHPITVLADKSKALSGGDLSVSVENTNRDEIGILAKAFNEMARKLRELITQVRNSTMAVTDAAALIGDSSRSVVNEIRQQEKAVEETSASILEMSGSIQEVNQNVESLSHTASETSSSILEMDASSSEIASHMDELSASIDICSSSTSEMNASIREISVNLETLGRATENTVSSFTEFNASVKQVENNADQSHVLSEKTLQEAQKGVQSVQHTIEGMDAIKASFDEMQQIISRLSGHSSSIGKVVKVITDITGKTNLLSLNAAIIAAQAGEHGRGFSIVAQEIKSLADRTAASTQEISNLIKGVQGETATAVESMRHGAEKVMKGVSLSTDAGQVLKTIIESSRRSTQMVMAIVQATQQQAARIQEVNRAMFEVRDMVEQINRAIREQEVASTEVMNSIDNIRKLGLRVKESTREQSKGSKSIASSTQQVTEMIRQILNATNEQTKGNQRIQQALVVFRQATDGNIRRAAELSDVISSLSTQSKELEREIGRFKV